MPDIAVIGPGAIGGTVAAWLAQEPANAVTVCARIALDRLLIETPVGSITARPRVILLPGTYTPVDWILIATKAYDVDGTALWLRSLAGPETRVAVLQNGVEHVERFSRYVVAPNLVPVIVDLPAERLGPGRVRQRRDGTLTVAADANGEAFAKLFGTAGLKAVLTADFRSQAWRKLTVNCAGAVSALVLQPAGIAASEPVGEIMRLLMRECIAVGRAEGAILDDALAEEVLAGYRKGPADSVNSLLADRLAGRPLEIDARNGAVVRFGRRHGIPTPVNQLLLTLLEATRPLS
jgi:2-dehydropantoate 2-reductase